MACGLLVAACKQDLVPQPGIEPGPPALGAQSLTHWTTREVPLSARLDLKVNCSLCEEIILKSCINFCNL